MSRGFNIQLNYIAAMASRRLQISKTSQNHRNMQKMKVLLYASDNSTGEKLKASFKNSMLTKGRQLYQDRIDDLPRKNLK